MDWIKTEAQKNKKKKKKKRKEKKRKEKKRKEKKVKKIKKKKRSPTKKKFSRILLRCFYYLLLPFTHIFECAYKPFMISELLMQSSVVFTER